MRILEIVKAINNNRWFIFVGTVLASLAAISTIYSNNKKDKKNEKDKNDNPPVIQKPEINIGEVKNNIGSEYQFNIGQGIWEDTDDRRKVDFNSNAYQLNFLKEVELRRRPNDKIKY